jgi:RNA polymerase sigma-70 factor (ECF subfamily)
MSVVRLVEWFLTHCARAAGVPPEALQDTLERVLAAAHDRWPALAIPDEDFLRYVAERLPTEGDVLAALTATHAADLYLACGCTRRDQHALRAFDREFIAQVSTYLRRADALPGITDEVKQILRTRLLLGDGQLLPRIARYGGRGPLGAWLRVTAARAGLHLRETLQPPRPGDPDLLLPGAAHDPEFEYLRAHYGAELRSAFESTLAALSRREGAVLRLHYLEGMTANAIGALFRVSGRTVQRWLTELRQHILAETHRRLGERLGLSSSDLRGLLGLLQSEMDVSIARVLERTAEP